MGRVNFSEGARVDFFQGRNLVLWNEGRAHLNKLTFHGPSYNMYVVYLNFVPSLRGYKRTGVTRQLFDRRAINKTKAQTLLVS